MKKYTIYYRYTVFAEVDVEAENEDNARRKFESDEMVFECAEENDTGEYIIDSIEEY